MDVLGLIPGARRLEGHSPQEPRAGRGKPLLAWTVDAARAASELTRVVVSTDDDEIAAAADVDVLRRPPELAADDTPMLDVIRHAIDELVAGRRRAAAADVAASPRGARRRGGSPAARERRRLRRQRRRRAASLSPRRADGRRRRPRHRTRNAPARVRRRSSSTRGTGRRCSRVRSDRLGDDLYAGDCRPYLMDERDSLDVDEPFDLELAISCSDAVRLAERVERAILGGDPTTLAGRARLKAAIQAQAAARAPRRPHRALPRSARSSSSSRSRTSCPSTGTTIRATTAQLGAIAAELGGPVVDVGANVGDTAAAIRAESGVPILCVEGDPTFFALLERNARTIGGVELEHAFVEGPNVGRIERGAGTAHVVEGDEALAVEAARADPRRASGVRAAGADQARHGRDGRPDPAREPPAAASGSGPCSSSSTTRTSARSRRCSSGLREAGYATADWYENTGEHVATARATRPPPRPLRRARLARATPTSASGRCSVPPCAAHSDSSQSPRSQLLRRGRCRSRATTRTRTTRS